MFVIHSFGANGAPLVNYCLRRMLFFYRVLDTPIINTVWKTKSGICVKLQHKTILNNWTVKWESKHKTNKQKWKNPAKTQHGVGKPLDLCMSVHTHMFLWGWWFDSFLRYEEGNKDIGKKVKNSPFKSSAQHGITKPGLFSHCNQPSFAILRRGRRGKSNVNSIMVL